MLHNDNFSLEEKSLGNSIIYKNYDIPEDIKSFFEKEQNSELDISLKKIETEDNNVFNKIYLEQKTKGTLKKDINKENLNEKVKGNKNSEGKNKEKINKKKGRNPKIGGKHNKYSDDNLRRKCKHILINELQIFINNKIREIYNDNIGQGIFLKQLLSMNQKQKANANVIFNREFLYKSLKDIFSENISTKYTILPLNYNKILIEQLMNEHDKYKRLYFQNLFNLTFIQCLNHFRGKEIINELIGLTKLEEIKEKYNFEDVYFNNLIYYFLRYEEIIYNKRIRKSNKNKK